jgi:hypothetical protein
VAGLLLPPLHSAPNNSHRRLSIPLSSIQQNDCPSTPALVRIRAHHRPLWKVLSLPTTPPTAQIQDMFTPLKSPLLGQTTALNLSSSRWKRRKVCFVHFRSIRALVQGGLFLILIQFHSPALDPMAGNMESTGSEHKDQGTLFVLSLFRFSCPSILRILARSPQPSIGIPLEYSSFSDPFYFLSGRAFHYER